LGVLQRQSMHNHHHSNTADCMKYNREDGEDEVEDVKKRVKEQ
jgi:hypothetical protein